MNMVCKSQTSFLTDRSSILRRSKKENPGRVCQGILPEGIMKLLGVFRPSIPPAGGVSIWIFP